MKPRAMRIKLLPLYHALLLGVPFIHPATAATQELAGFSLEQLAQTQVTSVAKKPQKLEDAAAAIHVISQEDIRRSGLTSLSELLRLAPGVQVNQIDASTSAVGIRGFAGRYSNKLLVLLDGRAVYTPAFGGVLWDTLDTPLEDVERIEIIRGSGGTLWGANATNGVINIITRNAAATHGTLLSGGIGDQERRAAARYGAAIGEYGDFRVYGKHSELLPYQNATGAVAHDRMAIQQAGFRADWRIPGGDTFTAQGDAYKGNGDHSHYMVTLAPPYVAPLDFSTGVSGQNLLLRWNRALSAKSDWTLQFYWDRYRRNDVQSREQRSTYDLDFQHRFRFGERHDIVWGAGYRRSEGEFDNTFMFALNPARSGDSLVNVFIQDEIELARTLRFTVGSKFEHNEHTGLEIQPNLRLLWQIDPRQTAWTAVSRAVRTPSSAENHARINIAAAPGRLFSIFGNDQLDAEKLLSYEAGYRTRFGNSLILDATAFYNEYDDLGTSLPMPPYFESVSLPPHLVVGSLYSNAALARSHGVELTGNWRIDDHWTLKGSYTRLSMATALKSGGSVPTTPKGGDSPANQWQAHAQFQANRDLYFGASLYYRSELAAQKLPAYTRADLQMRWRGGREVEFGLAGRNLADARHVAYLPLETPSATEVPRSIFASVTWRH